MACVSEPSSKREDDDYPRKCSVNYMRNQSREDGSLYPDHVIFLGDRLGVAEQTESLTETVKRITADGGTAPVVIVIPNQCVLLKKGANPGQHAMARCLADVTARLPKTAKLNYLGNQNVYELLNWEAEHYRQKINKT